MKLAVPLCLLLTACTQANHLGCPLAWPGYALQSTVLNAAYNARRAKVSTFVTANQTSILSDAKAKSGPTLAEALNLAQVPQTRRPALTDELANNPLYRQNAKALVVALMVHGA